MLPLCFVWILTKLKFESLKLACVSLCLLYMTSIWCLPILDLQLIYCYKARFQLIVSSQLMLSIFCECQCHPQIKVNRIQVWSILSWIGLVVFSIMMGSFCQQCELVSNYMSWSSSGAGSYHTGMNLCGSHSVCHSMVCFVDQSHPHILWFKLSWLATTTERWKCQWNFTLQMQLVKSKKQTIEWWCNIPESVPTSTSCHSPKVKRSVTEHPHQSSTEVAASPRPKSRQRFGVLNLLGMWV